MKFLIGTKIYSILTSTCPVCQKGKMYIDKNPYNLGNTLKMHERCLQCGTKFKIEPSFFYGAMYVSYGLGVAVAICTFIISYFLFGFERLTTFFIIVGILVLLLPILLRGSRNIWINMFFNFNKKKM